VHSQYRRRLADLPGAGVRIALILRMRRFFCDDLACKRRIFAERFEAVGPRARRTSRLGDVSTVWPLRLEADQLPPFRAGSTSR
jgi:hypothetical protein